MSHIRFLTACIVFLTWTVPSQGQTKAKQAAPLAPVDSVDSIAIGMPGDHVIAGLTKSGYTPREIAADSGYWTVDLKGKSVGEFSLKNGRVDSAERKVFPVKEDESIDFAEALFWLIYDNGATVQSKDRDWKETTTPATLDTRDIGSRTAGSSHRMIFVTMKNGATFRITMLRTSDGRSGVSVNEMAPFIKKK